MEPHREEGLFVGELQVAADRVVEIGGQVGITERHRKRIGVVEHRHELARRRLRAAAPVEEADVAVVVEIVEQHRTGGPVDPLVVVALAVGLVVGVGRVGRDAELGAGLAFLVHEGEAGALVDVAVEDLVGIVRIGRLAVTEIFHPGFGHIVIESGAAVEREFVGIVLVPAVLVTGLEIEVPSERLGIDNTAPEAAGDGRLVDALVDDVGRAAVRIGNGLIPGIEFVAGEVPGQVRGNRTARHAEALAEEEEAVGLHRAGIAVVGRETLVGVAQDVVRKGLGVELRELIVAAAADIELRLEEDGGVLAELVLDAKAQSVTVRAAVAQTVVVGDEGRSILEVGLLVGILLDIGFRPIIEVVAAEVHLVAEEVPVAVDAAHPAREDAVGAAPAAAHAAATAHSAAAHRTHHVAGEVVETAVVGIVAVEDDADLALVGEAAAHEGTLITPVVVAVLVLREVMAGSGHRIAEEAVHHAALDGQVDDGFLLAVVDAGEFGLFGFLLDDLDLLNQLRRNVLGSELRVVEKEGLAADGNLGHRLATGSNGSVGFDFEAGEFLQQVDEHVVVADLEGGGIVLDRVFLDDNGIARRGDRRGFEHAKVHVHLEDAEVDILVFQSEFLSECLVSQHFSRYGITSVTHLLEDGLAVGIGQHIGRLGRGIALGGDGNRSERNGLAARGVFEGQGDIVSLGRGRQGESQGEKAGGEGGKPLGGNL